MNTLQKVLIADSHPQSCGEIESAMTCSITTASNYDDAIGLTDTDNAISTFPAGISDFTKSADMDALKNNRLHRAGNPLDEVFGTLKDYNDEMCSSIRYASQIQKALLPGENNLKRLMDSFVFSSAKNIVSGDFFWLSIRYGRVILAVADCTGHGVPAALLSIIGHNMLSTIVNEKGMTEPAQILKQLNQRVKRVFENGEEGSSALKDGMDIAVISIDPDSRTIDYAGARRPITGFINGEFVKIKGDLHSIGSHSPVSAEFSQHRIAFGPQDVFYLGSDGFADQFGGPNNKKIGTRKYEEFLQELCLLNTTEQKHQAETFFQEWKKGNEQTDDVLLIGIKPGSLLC